jgi:hypothetical protein
MLALPAYLQAAPRPFIRFNNFDIDVTQDRLLASVCETLIPRTDTPGAKDIGVYLFVMKMVDDCYDKGTQQKFMNGLAELESGVKKRTGKAFADLPAIKRKEILQNIDKENGHQGDVVDFYHITKSRAIQGYLNSKYVMTKQLVYELVPGRYNGYFPVKTTPTSRG